MISSFVNVSIQYGYLRKFINIKKMFVGTLKYLLFSLIMGGIVVVVSRATKMQSTIITTIIQVLIGIIVYGILLILSKDNLVIQAFAVVKTKFFKRAEF